MDTGMRAIAYTVAGVDRGGFAADGYFSNARTFGCPQVI
jgi:hypothetical protein